jgi:hypothetical protein
MALTVEFQPVLDAADLLRRADKDLQKLMRREVARTVNPWLKSAIRRNARDPQSRKIAGTARVRSGQRPAVVVGSASKFAGGASTADLARVYEFGGWQGYRRGYARTNRGGGGRHKVVRRTQRQIPRADRQGRFVYPAVADAAPMLVGAWVAAIADAYQEASHGR